MTSLHEIVDRQLRRWESERLAALEAARQAGARARLAAPPTVTVARQAGVRGAAIARALASRLGYQLFDQEIIDYIALHHEVRRKLLEMLDEQTASGIRLWAEGIVRGQHLDRADFFRFLSKTVRAIHTHGNAVILGRGANFLLADARAFRVLLVAPMEARIAVLKEDRGLGADAARQALETSDAARSEFIHSFFHAEWSDPRNYDLTLNVGGLPVAVAAAILEDALRGFAAARWPEIIVGPRVSSTAAG
jgi:cytidylate kinase